MAEFIEQITSGLQALMPAALGSAVGQVWRPGLSWRDRLLQWLTGICVSYYVTLAAAEVFQLSPFVAQACGFVLAMMAFELAPHVTRAALDMVAELPAWLRRKLGGK